MKRLVIIVSLITLVLGTSERSAWSQVKTTFLVGKLQYPPASDQADDFRVRTNAALQLGATNDDAAVSPLCQSLATDPNEVVRQADAVALKRLARRSSLQCLKARLPVEANAAVKLQVTRAIDGIESTSPEVAQPGGPDDIPKMVKDAKFYVRVARITHNLDRPQQDISTLVLNTVRTKFDALGQYQLAPLQETPEQAKAVISKRKLKGYELAVSVEETYADGNLKMRVKIAVLTYPGKVLRGEVNPGASTAGRPGDRGTEDALTTLCTEKAIEQFSQAFP